MVVELDLTIYQKIILLEAYRKKLHLNIQEYKSRYYNELQFLYNNHLICNCYKITSKGKEQIEILQAKIKRMELNNIHWSKNLSTISPIVAKAAIQKPTIKSLRKI